MNIYVNDDFYAMAASLATSEGLSLKVTQGRIQDFNVEEAQQMRSAHHERKARNPFNSGGIHGVRLKSTGRIMVLNALSCYLGLIFKHSDTKQ